MSINFCERTLKYCDHYTMDRVDFVFLSRVLDFFCQAIKSLAVQVDPLTLNFKLH